MQNIGDIKAQRYTQSGSGAYDWSPEFTDLCMLITLSFNKSINGSPICEYGFLLQPTWTTCYIERNP